MSPTDQIAAVWTRPTRLSTVAFQLKAALLRLRRAATNLGRGRRRLAKADPRAGDVVIARSTSALWSDAAPGERGLQLGKVQNLRIACRSLDGVTIPAGAEFSFWRQIGAPTRGRGFVPGRMLQQGCMVASVGGGLCQLSNALYDVALAAGCRILERHAHSRVVSGSAAEVGRDATVAWNYIDLRFVATRAMRVSATLDRTNLIVSLSGTDVAALDRAPRLAEVGPVGGAARSCAACGEVECFLHERAAPARPGRRAFLVDEVWPEFQKAVAAAREPADLIGMPIDGALLGLTRYGWPTCGFAEVRSAPLQGVRRALALRRLRAQGALRRQAELDSAGRIAASLARHLTADVTHLTVAQSYLPFLWRDGHLGGREVSVLMTRLPMAALQYRLDAFAKAHPELPTLADFRAPAWLVAAEAEALAQAMELIAPHAQIAAMFGSRGRRLPWAIPSAASISPGRGPLVAFPGPTVARKGAHVLRVAARELGLEVIPLGAELEGAGFWTGLHVARSRGWRDAALMVQPALVEDQPRRLLAALAAGMPVIATPACGLDPQPGLTLVEPDDPAALIAALTAVLDGETLAQGRMDPVSAFRSVPSEGIGV